MFILRMFFYLVLLLIFVIIVYFSYLGYQSRQANPQGLINARLAPCPDKPNCVSSQADSQSSHFLPAISIANPKALELASAAILTMGGTINSRQGHYIAATFTSSLFGFVDDVELLWEPEQGKLQVRSASRVGHSDMGANRKRVEILREQLR